MKRKQNDLHKAKDKDQFYHRANTSKFRHGFPLVQYTKAFFFILQHTFLALKENVQYNYMHIRHAHITEK